MNKINLQNKTKALEGRIEMYYFENQNIQLEKTLFHRIYIPLTSFTSGLEYETQPIETVIVMDWLNLKLQNRKHPSNSILYRAILIQNFV